MKACGLSPSTQNRMKGGKVVSLPQIRINSLYIYIYEAYFSS